MLSVTDNIDDFERSLTHFERQQLPFAVSFAINETLADVKREEERLLPVRLDRPTAFTQRGLAIKRATKRRLVGQVGFKPIQSEYLQKVEEGGIRKPKKKAILVPVNQRVNKYGNLPKGVIRRLLARPNVFSGNVKGVAGIWQRMKGGRLKLLVAYERQASYRPQLHFQSDAQVTARRHFPTNMRDAMARAIRTAR